MMMLVYITTPKDHASFLNPLQSCTAMQSQKKLQPTDQWNNENFKRSPAETLEAENKAACSAFLVVQHFFKEEVVVLEKNGF